MGQDEVVPAEGWLRRTPGAGPQRRAKLPRRATSDTHASTTDPEAKLDRKGRGKEAKLWFIGHFLTENRHGLLVAGRISPANGTAEREVAETMLAAVPGRHKITVGGDQGLDTRDFVAAMCKLKVTPHVAQNTSSRCSAIDGRITRHPSYAVSQRSRKRIEEMAQRSSRRRGGLAKNVVLGIALFMRHATRDPFWPGPVP